MCSRRDSKAVANKLLAEGIAEVEIEAVPKDKVPDSPGRNVYFNGSADRWELFRWLGARETGR